MVKQALLEMEEEIKKTIEKLKAELVSIRTGRASLMLLEGIKVDYYGSHMALNQVASMSIPEPRTIEIKPWDHAVIPVIEKAILGSGLGLTPINDGKMIRINIPTLTQERRVELARLIKKLGEEYRVSVRGARRDAVEKIKKLQKDKQISEDDERASEHEVQKMTDLYVKRIDELVAAKEKEITEV